MVLIVKNGTREEQFSEWVVKAMLFLELIEFDKTAAGAIYYRPKN